MKIIMLAILTMVLTSCSEQKKPSPMAVSQGIDSLNYFDKHKLYTQSDTIAIDTFAFDTVRYTRGEFNRIIDLFPVLYSRIPEHPDQAYQKSDYFKDYTDEKGVQQHLSFNSEVGRDAFYVLYAYFIRQTITGNQLNTRRQRLNHIFGCINSIYANLASGGTYFGHQEERIRGYAEYSLYQFQLDSTRYLTVKNISAQKRLYLRLMRQHITDDMADNYIQPDYKRKLNDRYSYLLRRLDDLITDNFYLKKAIEFEQANY